MHDNRLPHQLGNEPQPSAMEEDDVIDIRALISTLWRRKWVLVNVTVFFSVLAVLILVQVTPRYTASGLMAIESRQSSVVDLEAVLSGMSTDVAAIKTEIDVLQSRRLASKLVDKLQLTKDVEFNSALDTKKGLLGLLNPFNYLPQAWSDAVLGRKIDTRSEEQKAEAIKSKVVDVFLSKLSITNPARSYSMQVSFESTDARKAARIVNTLADLYLTDQLEVKFEATQRANDWLNGRVADLRENVRSAEQAAQAFREENQLIQTRSSGTVVDQQLAQINSQLIDARTELARTEARQEQASVAAQSNSGNDNNNLLEVLQSPLIQRLKEQQSEVQRRRAELATRYGPKHPTMINIEAEKEDISGKIALETRRIISAIQSEAEIAAIRVKTLERNLTALRLESFNASRAQVRMSELEREAQAGRVLLETFLARFKETTSQNGLQQADARIISRADVPTEASFPKKKLTLLLVMFAAAGLGVGLIFLLEALDNGYRTSEQLRSDLRLRGLGMIPLIGGGKLKGMGPEEYLRSKPTSSFAEAHRSIHASLMFSGLEDQAKKVLAITSSVPGEGKSTAALCMAQILGRTGLKVLIIEADLRRPVLRHRLNLDQRRYACINDILDPLDDTDDLEIYTDELSGVQYLWADRHDDPQRLFSSNKFTLFLDEARKQYDLVLLDTPPVMAVSDVVVISKHVDAILFAVQWEKTSREIVRSAVAQLRQTNARLAGSILTQVDVKRHKGYGYGDQGYYYGTKSGYYTN